LNYSTKGKINEIAFLTSERKTWQKTEFKEKNKTFTFFSEIAKNKKHIILI
jgi:hypothetical protein